jgi:DNA-binding PadR family transcriptional regulator
VSLKYAVLGFLVLSPLTGYGLKKAFDSSVRHFWFADQSQIYRTLKLLVEEGLTDVEPLPAQEGPASKVYHITEAGSTELHRWLTTPLPPREEHDAFLVQFFFASALPDAEVVALLEREAALDRDLLAHYDQVARHSTPADGASPSRAQAFAFLTLEYGVRMTQAHLHWVEDAIAQLKRSPEAPSEQHS